MKKKLVSVLMATAMVATLFAGCGKSGDSAKSSKGSVYWLNFKPEADEALQGIAKTYKDETGVDVKVVTAAEGKYESTLTSEMDKSSAPTLFVVGNQAAVKTWGDYCYDLSDTDVYKELNTDAFTLKKEDGSVASIGYCYETYGIIVNKTLLEKAGHSVDEIKDFASLKEVADDIHANASTLGFDAFTSSGMDDSSSWRFSGHLANMPLYYESVDDNWTECPAEIKGTYLNEFKNIWDLYTTDTATAKSDLATGGFDAEAEFKDGKAVFYQNGSWEYDALSESWGDDEMTMIPIYTGHEGEENIGLCSGTENCWAVNANASEADIQATLDFMKWMVTSDEGTKMMAEQFGIIPYKGAAESTNVFLNRANELANEGKTTVTWAFNYTPNVNDWRAGVVAAMNNYDAGGDWADVEKAFVDGWATQYKAANN
ncbi:MAG: ABC transporter substrate-binding protein [Lachnospiraceae bacterium]|nr:ABC transporter substrate-binding protein [Lachnospiraceae bacterium]